MDGHKLLYHLDRLSAWQSGQRIAPVHIDMGLTKGCNLRCRYCYGTVQRMTGAMIPREALLRFMHDAATSAVRSIGFIGDGEPLLNPAVYDAAQAGHDAGMDIAIGTNGTLLDHSRIAELLPCLSYLRFNISAAGADAYARIHQCPRELFDRAIAAIRACVAARAAGRGTVTIGLQMVLIPECVDQVLPLARLGAELGVDYFVIKHCSDSEDHQLGIPLEQYPAYEPMLRAAEQLSTERYRVIVKWRKIMAAGHKRYHHCLAIPFLLQISGNGDVKPCGFLFPKEGYLMGNIVTQSFSDILRSETYWRIVHDLATQFDVHTRCGTGCRHDYVNEFLWQLVHEPPLHRAFL